MKFSQSLKKNRDFQFLYDNGSSYVNRALVMIVKENGSNINRLGISVSKKVGNSVIRHRVKRLIKEAYRLHEDEFNNGLDIVVVARPITADADYRKIEKSLLHVAGLHKSVLINRIND